MHSVATVTQPQGTPAVLVQSLPFSGATTRVAGTPRALLGEDAMPPQMMLSTGMPRSARVVTVPLVNRREILRIVALAALAALVAMTVAGLGRLAMGSSEDGDPSEPLAAPPTPMPLAPECPAVEAPPPPTPPPAVEPPQRTAPPPAPVSSEPFVIPSALPPLPGLPELSAPD